MKPISPLYVLLVFLLLPVNAVAEPFSQRLSDAAIERTSHSITYDGGYRRIGYPMGDVPAHIGVCTDVVIRSYRKLGLDLQLLVHHDMKENFSEYPSKRIWGMTKPDTNIDHRRVPNLRAFFARHGNKLAVTDKPEDYLVGDMVTWMLPGNLPHIGIVTHKRSLDGKRPIIAHNIGAGPKLEDMLFSYTITGHYRFNP